MADSLTGFKLIPRPLPLLAVFLLATTPTKADPGVAEARTEAVPGPSAVRRISLEEALRLAQANYPKIAEARARLAYSKAQLKEAYFAPFSHFTVTGAAGVLPPWKGTAVYSPSSSAALTSNMNVAYQLALEGVVPLWTFGKITNLWDAARAGVDAGTHAVEKERTEIRFEVRRAYYGVQLARDALILVDEARSRVDEYSEKLEEGIVTGDADEIDLLKLKVQGAELIARQSEATQKLRVALAGLRFFTGTTGTLDTLDEPLRALPHQLGPVSRYLEAARLHRPEINMARAGIRAREAQRKIARARYFPDLGLALTAKLPGAPGSTRQRNPFGYDIMNTPYVGIGLVLHWELDFLPQSARVAQATAQLEEMRATEQFALGGVAVEVEEAFEQVQDAKRRLEAWGDAAQFAKQWLIKVQQGLDLGLTEDEDLVDPSKEFALKRFSEMAAIFDYNVALAALAAKTGWEGLLGEG